MPRWSIRFDHNVDINNDMLTFLVKAEAHRQITARVPLPPGVAAKIDRIEIARQIRGTTGIEGNNLTMDEIEHIVDDAAATKQVHESLPASSPSEDVDSIEVMNAYAVQEFIRETPRPQSGIPIVTEELIRELHRLSTSGVPSDRNSPGSYRTCIVHAAEYYPPEPEDIPDLMCQFIEFINRRELTHGVGSLIRAIMAHFYLVSIHPFGDGNGRTARALEAFIMYQSGFNARGFYSLANFYYRHREEYVRQLDDARFRWNGNLTQFIRFALKGLVEGITEVQERVLSFVRETVFMSYVEELLQNDVINARCYAILDYLVKGSNGIPRTRFKDRRLPLIRGLYESIKTDRTIERDLTCMQKEHLIVIGDDGVVRANIAIMEQFEG